MKSSLKALTVVAVLSLCIGFAAADITQIIPGYVDFHAYTTNPWTDFSLGSYPTDIELRDAQYAANLWAFESNTAGVNAPWWMDTDALMVYNTGTNLGAKHIWLAIEFDGQLTSSPIVSPLVWSIMGDDLIEGGSVVPTVINNQSSTTFVWTWELNPQPQWEWIMFVDMDQMMSYPMAGLDVGGNDVLRIDVATYAVPVPGSLLLLGIGLASIGFAKKANRRK